MMWLDGSCFYFMEQRCNPMDYKMYFRQRSLVLFGLIAVLFSLCDAKAEARVVLITAEEAKLPVPKEVVHSRAITRGPRIEVSNLDEGKLHSPLHFKLIFRAYAGSTIDIDSLTVTYLRGSNIDLTQRVRPFARSTGIDIPDAEVPSGNHAIRVDLKDSEGRPATTSFVLTITPD